MEAGVRLICLECLRSVESAGDGGPAPTRCPICGAVLEIQRDEDPTAQYETPISLALTPEEESPWWRDLAAAPEVPSTIGRFRLRELLGGGGFGQVYRAYDPRLDREVALKVLKEVHPAARVMERFFREARAAAQLDHPHIVWLYDAGRDEGRCWIAYQFVKGQTLTQRCELQRPSIEEAVRIGLLLARALDHAHNHGVVHRDVKPGNVILDATGQPRLTDFGLARRSDFDPTLTREGTVLGTPAYMSPEQASGHSHVADARSDVYSLGVMLYELLCGRRPVDLPSVVPAWRLDVGSPVTPARSINRAVPRALDRVCRTALAPQPSDRYGTAFELAEELERWLNRPRGRWRIAVGAVLSVCSGCLLGASLSHRTNAGPTPAPDRAATPAISAQPLLSAAIAKPAPLPIIVGVPRSRLFHRASCMSIRGHRLEDLQQWPTPEAAKSQGRAACRLCISSD